MVCDDGVPCTIETCDPTKGCVSTPKTCDDGVACTVDGCAQTTGDCTHSPDDAACGPGTLCAASSCEASKGCVSTEVSCEDGIACTVDSCDPVTGDCVHTLVDEACQSPDFCAMATCLAGVGCSFVSIDCDDSDPCTSDGCDPSSGCTHAPIPCDDGDPCTLDGCSGGACMAAQAPNGTPCPSGVCLSGECVACVSDGDCPAVSCATVQCVDNACLSVPVVCDDANPCTDDTCNDGACDFAAKLSGPCNDGDPCTWPDGCASGVCVGQFFDCNDLDPCTDDQCNGHGGCTHSPGPDGVPCAGGVCAGGTCVPPGSCTRDCCTTSYGVAGCPDPDIEACVCALDPWCCVPGGADGWTEGCTMLAINKCGATCGRPGCTFKSTTGLPEDPTLEACACDANPNCCTGPWTQSCVTAAMQCAGDCSVNVQAACGDDNVCTAEWCESGACIHAPLFNMLCDANDPSKRCNYATTMCVSP